MNTQSQPGAQLSQLRHMMERMSGATLSSIDEHGALLIYNMSRWEMDDSGTLWLFADRLSLPSVNLQSINLSFAETAGTRRVSLSGRAEVYAEGLSSEYWLESIWPGHINSPRFIAQAPLNNQALLKFTAQSAVYWYAQPSLMVRLLTLLASVFGVKAASVNRAVQCVELPPPWELDAPKSAT